MNLWFQSHHPTHGRTSSTQNQRTCRRHVVVRPERAVTKAATEPLEAAVVPVAGRVAMAVARVVVICT